MLLHVHGYITRRALTTVLTDVAVNIHTETDAMIAIQSAPGFWPPCTLCGVEQISPYVNTDNR